MTSGGYLVRIRTLTAYHTIVLNARNTAHCWPESYGRLDSTLTTCVPSREYKHSAQLKRVLELLHRIVLGLNRALVWQLGIRLGSV